MASDAATDNEWAYVEIVNLADRTDILDGATGLALTTDTAVYNYNINVDGLDYIAVEVASYSAGTVDVRLALYEES